MQGRSQPASAVFTCRLTTSILLVALLLLSAATLAFTCTRSSTAPDGTCLIMIVITRICTLCQQELLASMAWTSSLHTVPCTTHHSHLKLPSTPSVSMSTMLDILGSCHSKEESCIMHGTDHMRKLLQLRPLLQWGPWLWAAGGTTYNYKASTWYS